MNPLRLLALLTAASLAAFTASAHAADEVELDTCVTLTGDLNGATSAKVCFVKSEDAAHEATLQIDGASLLGTADLEGSSAREDRDLHATAAVIPFGAGQALVRLSLHVSQEGTGANDCDYSSRDTLTAWAVHTPTGWALASPALQDFTANLVRCREEPAYEEVNARVTLTRVLTLDAPTAFVAHVKLQSYQGFDDGDDLSGLSPANPATARLEALTYDAAKGALVAADWTTCAPGTTRDAADPGLRCLDADGKLHGPQKTLNKKGALIDQAWFHHGGRVGAYAKWHDSGALKLLGTYDAQGLGQGRWFAFHDSGIVRKDEDFTDGKVQSTRTYNPTGLLTP
jgi:hypothetical protein